MGGEFSQKNPEPENPLLSKSTTAGIISRVYL